MQFIMSRNGSNNKIVSHNITREFEYNMNLKHIEGKKSILDIHGLLLK